MIKDLEALASRLERSRSHIYNIIAGLSEAQLSEPSPGGNWSIHDMLAHLAANEELMTDLAYGIATGESTSMGEDFDNDRYNAESVAQRREKATSEILDELHDSRERLETLLDKVTPDQLTRRGEHPLQGWLNLKEFLVVMLAHEVTHGREMEEQTRRIKAENKK
jgi:uncharacterized protein (TIGR03083 family)